MGMRGTQIGEFPSGGGTVWQLQGHGHRLAWPGRGVQQGPALRAAPERESAGRQSLGMAHPFEGTTLMMAMRTNTRPFALVAAAATIAVGLAVARGGATAGAQAQAGAPPVFTAAQASAGRDVYQARCAGCHLPDLAGRNDAPPLAGATFFGVWRARTTRELAEYIRASMPPGGPPLGIRRGGRRHRLHPGQQQRQSRRDRAHRRHRRAGGHGGHRRCYRRNAGGRATTRGPHHPATRRRAPPGHGCLRAPPARRPAGTTWSARCRATRRSPTRCCAHRRPATG